MRRTSNRNTTPIKLSANQQVLLDSLKQYAHLITANASQRGYFYQLNQLMAYLKATPFSQQRFIKLLTEIIPYFGEELTSFLYEPPKLNKRIVFRKSQQLQNDQFNTEQAIEYIITNLAIRTDLFILQYQIKICNLLNPQKQLEAIIKKNNAALVQALQEEKCPFREAFKHLTDPAVKTAFENVAAAPFKDALGKITAILRQLSNIQILDIKTRKGYQVNSNDLLTLINTIQANRLKVTLERGIYYSVIRDVLELYDVDESILNSIFNNANTNMIIDEKLLIKTVAEINFSSNKTLEQILKKGKPQLEESQIDRFWCEIKTNPTVDRKTLHDLLTKILNQETQIFSSAQAINPLIEEAKKIKASTAMDINNLLTRKSDVVARQELGSVILKLYQSVLQVTIPNPKQFVLDMLSFEKMRRHLFEIIVNPNKVWPLPRARLIEFQSLWKDLMSSYTTLLKKTKENIDLSITTQNNLKIAAQEEAREHPIGSCELFVCALGDFFMKIGLAAGSKPHNIERLNFEDALRKHDTNQIASIMKNLSNLIENLSTPLFTTSNIPANSTQQYSKPKSKLTKQEKINFLWGELSIKYKTRENEKKWQGAENLKTHADKLFNDNYPNRADKMYASAFAHLLLIIGSWELAEKTKTAIDKLIQKNQICYEENNEESIEQLFEQFEPKAQENSKKLFDKELGILLNDLEEDRRKRSQTQQITQKGESKNSLLATTQSRKWVKPSLTKQNPKKSHLSIGAQHPIDRSSPLAKSQVQKPKNPNEELKQIINEILQILQSRTINLVGLKGKIINMRNLVNHHPTHIQIQKFNTDFLQNLTTAINNLIIDTPEKREELKKICNAALKSLNTTSAYNLTKPNFSL